MFGFVLGATVHLHLMMMIAFIIILGKMM